MVMTALPQCVAVVGLGYVGLPLASAFGRALPTIGYDVNENRIRELRAGADSNGEVKQKDLQTSLLEFTAEPAALKRASFLVIAVPTPVNKANRPDLSCLIEASRLVGRNLAPGATVVYESTVYPGCTEEVCLPVLEQASGLKAGRDFKVGYSPERINPGDSEHTLDKVTKIVAAQDAESCDTLSRVYSLVAKAGVYRAPTIRAAEAAKVIENVQRDLNIALMNELTVLFHRMGLDTAEVLKAARTKWNFLHYEPGLVGGHCIPVDPYYLTYKAQELGYHPEVILAGRRINDFMGHYVAQETVKLLIKAGKVVNESQALILGVSFKENVCDARNTRVADLARELHSYGIAVSVYDPFVEPAELRALKLTDVHNPFATASKYDAVILAVPHKLFRDMPAEAFFALLRNGDRSAVLVDVKGVLKDAPNKPGVLYWSL